MTDIIGCGDSSCVFSIVRKKGGQHTNGGCRCFKDLERWIPEESRWNRQELRRIQSDVQRLASELRTSKDLCTDLAKALITARRALCDSIDDYAFTGELKTIEEALKKAGL